LQKAWTWGKEMNTHTWPCEMDQQNCSMILLSLFRYWALAEDSAKP
jgi:hypothetical protein